MHLTDEQLNEYLDNETNERELIELHLDSCDECSKRFSDLQNLFLELYSLPELQLTRDLSTRFITSGGLIQSTPRWLTLTMTLQIVLAMIALMIAIPFISTILPAIETLSFTSWIVDLQAILNTWFDSFSKLTLQPIPFELPTLPVLETTSLLLSLAGIFILWILGNGLLLRNQIRR